VSGKITIVMYEPRVPKGHAALLCYSAEHMDIPSTWQDWVIMVGQLVFLVALLPSVFTADKPNRWSSLLTALVIVAFGVTYWTLDMYFSVASSAALGLVWFILFLQKVRG